MQEVHKKAIQSNFKSLVDCTDLKNMSTSLYEKGVFSTSMFEYYSPADDSDDNNFVSLKRNNRKVKPPNPSQPPRPPKMPDSPPRVDDPEPTSSQTLNKGQDAIDKPSQIPHFQVMKSTKFVEPRPGLELYKTRGKNRGTLLLLSYVKFNYGVDDERPGTEVDVAKLKYLFSEMGFDVVAYENLSWQETQDMLTSLKEVVAGSETVFTVVSSHGYERPGRFDTEIRCSDGMLITDTQIIEFFDHNNMPALHGVPKVFIFQVCRGARNDYVALPNVHTDSQSKPPAAAPAPANTLRLRPLYSDTLVVHSTLPGSVSHRDPLKGSWYIQALCEVFAAEAHKYHVEKLFKEVDKLMQARHHIQTSSIDTRGFHKKLFLHPGLFE